MSISSIVRRFRLWIAGDEYAKVVLQRDVAERRYIKCERLLSKYRPTTPENISDEMISRRLSYGNSKERR